MKIRSITRFSALCCSLFMSSLNAQTTTDLLPSYYGDDDVASWTRYRNAKIGSPTGAMSKAFKFELTDYKLAPWWEISVPVLINTGNENSVVFKSRATQMPITGINECSELVSVIDFYDGYGAKIGSSMVDYFDVSQLAEWQNINTIAYDVPISTTSITLAILPDAFDSLDCSNVFAYFDQVELLLTETIPAPVCTVDVNMCELEATSAEYDFIGECVEECSGGSPPTHCPTDFLNGKTDLLVHCENRAETYNVYDETYNQCIHACD